jgi:hypothetical protein
LHQGGPQKLINNQPPYTVSEVANAYNAGGLSVNGSGQTIGISSGAYVYRRSSYRNGGTSWR